MTERDDIIEIAKRLIEIEDALTDVIIKLLKTLDMTLEEISKFK